MSRSELGVGREPYRTWTREVDDYQRVRFSGEELAAVVSWVTLEDDRIDCVAMPGAVGGVQLLPRTTYGRDVQPLLQALGAALPEAAEATRSWLEIVRFFATACEMPIHVEAKRISITLPEPLRRAGLLPQAGGSVVVFGSGEILEIWGAGKWHEHLRPTAARRNAALAEAIEDLRGR
jgi:DNA-binding transcriptional regulator/RsmH inhibitor MraZ